MIIKLHSVWGKSKKSPVLVNVSTVQGVVEIINSDNNSQINFLEGELNYIRVTETVDEIYEIIQKGKDA